MQDRVVSHAMTGWNRLVQRLKWVQSVAFWLLGIFSGYLAGRTLFCWFQPPWPEVAHDIPLALMASTLRLLITLALSLAWILPVIWFVWDRPRVRRALTSIAQVGASLPAVALFPLFIVLTVKKFGGGMETAAVLLLITGMQWYILFNCLGGTAIIPSDLKEASRSMGLTRLQTWRKLVFPAIRPALITGCITAWGGGWNALVFSEYVVYQGQPLSVHGIGALLSRAVYVTGDNRAIMFTLSAMVAWIVLINVTVWTPLYRDASERYRMDL